MLDEAQKQSFTDKIGVAVTWMRVPVPTPAGVAYQTVWTVLLTIPSGLAGVGDHSSSFTCERAAPPEADIRKAVGEVIEQLRQYRQQQTAQLGNGHQGGRSPGGLAIGRG